MGISVRKSTAPNDLRFLTADFAVRQDHRMLFEMTGARVFREMRCCRKSRVR